MTLELIETLKTSIYTPKDTKNTKAHFKLFKVFEKSSFMLICMPLFLIYKGTTNPKNIPPNVPYENNSLLFLFSKNVENFFEP